MRRTRLFGPAWTSPRPSLRENHDRFPDQNPIKWGKDALEALSSAFLQGDNQPVASPVRRAGDISKRGRRPRSPVSHHSREDDMEAYERLVKLVHDAADDSQKAAGGNKAAGTRVRIRSAPVRTACARSGSPARTQLLKCRRSSINVAFTIPRAKRWPAVRSAGNSIAVSASPSTTTG